MAHALPTHAQLVGAGIVLMASLLASLLRDSLSPALAGYVINLAMSVTFYLTGFALLSCELESKFSSVEVSGGAARAARSFVRHAPHAALRALAAVPAHRGVCNHAFRGAHAHR